MEKMFIWLVVIFGIVTTSIEGNAVAIRNPRKQIIGHQTNVKTEEAENSEFSFPNDAKPSGTQRVKRELNGSSAEVPGNSTLQSLTKARAEALYNMNQANEESKERNEVILRTLENQSNQLAKITNNLNELEKSVETVKETVKMTAILKEQKEIQTRKKKLLKYFHRSSANSKTISGIFLHSFGTSSKNEKEISTIYNATGMFPGVIGTHMPSPSADVSEWNSFIDELLSDWNKGHLIFLAWHGGSPLISMEVFTDTRNATDVETKWEDLITDGGQLNQPWKKQLDLIVPYLQQLQTAGVITILDIHPIMNHKDGIWRGRPGVNGTMKLFKITHAYLTDHHKLDSLIWTWSLNGHGLSELDTFWPGQEFVDVVSVYMGNSKEISTKEYEHLGNVVGDTPMSMENMFTLPTPQLLAAQPRWSRFTAMDYDKGRLKTTYSYTSVINRESLDFFNYVN